MLNRILVSILALALSLTLTACSSTPSPKAVVSGFLDALKAGDFEKAALFVAPEKELMEDLVSDEENHEEIVKVIFSRVSYDIKSEMVSGNQATVEAAITSLDLVRIVMQTMSELMPMAFALAFSDAGEDEMDTMFEQYLMNSISDPNAPTTTTNVTITLEKLDKH